MLPHDSNSNRIYLTQCPLSKRILNSENRFERRQPLHLNTVMTWFLVINILDVEQMIVSASGMRRDFNYSSGEDPQKKVNCEYSGDKANLLRSRLSEKWPDYAR